jgi:hypothetical protein
MDTDATEISTKATIVDSDTYKPHKYGVNEQRLGLAVNRKRQQYGTHHGNYDAYLNLQGNTLIIDIENDPLLQDKLQKIKDYIGEDPDTFIRDRKAMEAVRNFIPQITEDSQFTPSNEPRFLGEALQNPVTCQERALMMEAALKMAGVTDDAKMLRAWDTNCRRGKDSGHADVIFTFKDYPEKGKFIAVTMGTEAGHIKTAAAYQKYLQERENQGLGIRELHEDWGHPYFQTVN